VPVTMLRVSACIQELTEVCDTATAAIR